MSREEQDRHARLMWDYPNAAEALPFIIEAVLGLAAFVPDGHPARKQATAALLRAMGHEVPAQDFRAALRAVTEPMTEEQARNWHIRRDERNGRHTP